MPNSFYLHRQIPAPDSALRGNTEKFKLRITEKDAIFDEEIAIDEDNDLEYFSVPAHNDVLAADFLFDFKMVRFLSSLLVTLIMRLNQIELLAPGRASFSDNSATSLSLYGYFYCWFSPIT